MRKERFQLVAHIVIRCHNYLCLHHAQIKQSLNKFSSLALFGNYYFNFLIR